MSSTGEAHTYDINELSVLIDRRQATIRQWEREGMLPKRLVASRNERGRRSYTEEQVAGILEWMRDRFPGSGLKGYSPTPDELSAHVHAMRREREAA